MKIRFVKKSARIYREHPERVKPCHRRACIRAWDSALSIMTPYERACIEMALKQKPAPILARLAIIPEHGPETVMSPRGAITISGRQYDINMNPIP